MKNDDREIKSYINPSQRTCDRVRTILVSRLPAVFRGSSGETPGKRRGRHGHPSWHFLSSKLPPLGTPLEKKSAQDASPANIIIFPN